MIDYETMLGALLDVVDDFVVRDIAIGKKEQRYILEAAFDDERLYVECTHPALPPIASEYDLCGDCLSTMGFVQVWPQKK